MANATKNRKNNSNRNNKIYSPENEKNSPNKKRKVSPEMKIKGLIRTACVVFVVLLLLFVASETFQIATLSSTSDSIKSFISSLTPGDGYPYKISSSSVKDIKMLSSNLFMLTDNSTITLDKTAKEISKLDHTYASPAASINNGRAIVYDRGGNRYMVQSRTNKVYEGETKNKILTCAIGKSGNIAVATVSNNSNNYVTVYKSNKNKQLFKWVCYTEKVVDISLSDNGKYMAVATVSAKDGDVISKVYLFNFKYDSAVEVLDYPGTSLYKVDYVGRDNILAIGDNKKSFITNNSDDKKDVDFGTSILTRYSISDNDISAMVLSEFGSTNLNKLKVYSKTGKLLYEKKYDCKVKWVHCDGRYVNVLVKDKIIVLDLKGKEKKTIDVKSDSMKVFADGRTKYVYGIGEIRQRS